MEYNEIEEFCNEVCGYCIEWSKDEYNESSMEWEAKYCVSCQLQGESERIERVAEDCPFKKELENIKTMRYKSTDKEEC